MATLAAIGRGAVFLPLRAVSSAGFGNLAFGTIGVVGALHAGLKAAGIHSYVVSRKVKKRVTELESISFDKCTKEALNRGASQTECPKENVSAALSQLDEALDLIKESTLDKKTKEDLNQLKQTISKSDTPMISIDRNNVILSAQEQISNLIRKEIGILKTTAKMGTRSTYLLEISAIGVATLGLAAIRMGYIPRNIIHS